MLLTKFKFKFKFKFRYTTQFLHSLSTQTFDLIKPTETTTNVTEHHVLDQLSKLLPIRHQTLAQNQQLSLLSPEDKLRGVFIQKLNGTNAVKRALTAASVDLEVTCDLIARVVNRGNIDGGSMVTLFDWAVEHNKKLFHNVDTYNLLLKALGRRKYFDVMHNVLTDMRIKGLKPDNQTLFIFIDSFLKGRRVSKALRMFGKWECDLDSLKVMLRCLCHRSYVSAASTLLNKMKGEMECDGETYNIVIRGWARFGRVSEIERVVKEMVEDGFDPDGLTFSYVLEGLGRNGRIEDAVKMFESLKEREMCVYNAMIFNFISVGDIDECLKYYDAMLRNGCEPNVDTYVSIISAFLKARRVADALEMFDEMLGRDIMPTTGIVTSFIETLCSYGPPHAAMMIYKKAKDAKCTISVNAYKILLMRLSRFGKCGMLLNVWDEMEQSGYVSDVEVYEHIINGLCNNGQLEDAVVIMEECLKKGFCPSRLISAKLNNKLLDSNKVEMAYKLFLKVKKSRHGENARRFWRAKGWHF